MTTLRGHPASSMLRLAAMLLVVALAAHALLPRGAAAQDAPEGRITGTITSGTAGADPGDLEVRLLVLEDATVVDDIVTTSSDGSFEFTVPATDRRNYVVTLEYQGVQYLRPAVVLTPEDPEAEVAVTVYETAETAPEMRIVQTTVTVIALDRNRAELWLQREDVISVPGDRVFAGDENDVTLRIPAPEGTREVNGGTLEGGVVTVGGALFPGDQNRIVTAYIVRYDAAADEYGVRVTAPLPTDRIELRVPQGYVHEVEPLEEAAREDDLEMPQGETPEADDVTLEVVSLTGPVDPGRGLLANLVGLSGERLVHPLTQQPGAGIAALVALGVITGGAALVMRRGRGGGGTAVETS